MSALFVWVCFTVEQVSTLSGLVVTSQKGSLLIHMGTQKTQSVNIYPCTYLQSLGCSGAEWWLGSVWVVVVVVLVCNSVF